MRYRHRHHLLWLFDVVITSVSWVAASTALSIEILPPGEKFLDTCEPLNLKCVVKSPTNVEVSFSFCPEYPENAMCRDLTDAGPVTPWSPETNSTSIQLDIRRVAKRKHEGKYNCLVNKRIMKAVYVIITDSPPVTSIGVVSNDMDNFDVRWCVDETVNDSYCWQASWADGTDSGEKCNMTSVNNSCYTCNSRLSPQAYYAFTVSSCQLTTESAILSSITETIMPYCYVKPNPVDNLKAVTINSTAISLSWSPHNTEISELIYRITYYSLQQPHDKSVIEVTRSSGLSSELHEVIDNLEPNTTYYFTMVCREVDYGYWSEHMVKPIAAKTAPPAAVGIDETDRDKVVSTAIFVGCVVGIVVAIPVAVVSAVWLHHQRLWKRCHDLMFWAVPIKVPRLDEDPENPHRQDEHTIYVDNAHTRAHLPDLSSALPLLQGSDSCHSEQRTLLYDRGAHPVVGPTTTTGLSDDNSGENYAQELDHLSYSSENNYSMAANRINPILETTSDVSIDNSGENYAQADLRTQRQRLSLNSDDAAAGAIEMQQSASTNSTDVETTSTVPLHLTDDISVDCASYHDIDESRRNDDNDENDNETEDVRISGTSDQDPKDNRSVEYCVTEMRCHSVEIPGESPSELHYEEADSACSK